MLAHGAVLNVFSHKLHEVQPLELDSNKLAGFEISWLTGSFMVMTMRKDEVAKRVIQENIDIPFVSEDVVIIFPVQEMGPEGSRDVLKR